MIKNYIVFRDFETAELNPHLCQITEIAAVMIEPRSLTVVPNSLFHTRVQPEWDDEKAIKDNYLPVNFASLAISSFNKENLADAPTINVAWKEYTNYLSKYMIKGKFSSNFNAPIVAGYNSSNFDDIIDRRLCDRYGPKLNNRQDWKIYHPSLRFDLLHLAHMVWNNFALNERNSMSFDSVRDFMGMSKENAHRANVDVLQGAFMLTKFLRLFRMLSEGTIDIPLGRKIQYRNSFKEENELIEQILR